MTISSPSSVIMKLPDPIYIFRILTPIGFLTQWATMIWNGSFMAMAMTYPQAAFPSGTPLITYWSGILPVDYLLTLLVVFFGAVVNVADLPDIGPHLMLVDLVYALVVFNLMTVVEDRRNRKTGPLRSPAYWQFLWNGCGAASILPIYLHAYLTKRTTKPLPPDQAQALSVTALWSVLISLPLLLPGVVGATPFQIQKLMAIWFLAPLTLGVVQDLASRAFPNKGSNSGNSVIRAYWIAGSFSAVIHISVFMWAWLSPTVSWSRIYWPNHSAVKPDVNMLTEGAMLFMQYDHVIIYICVLALGVYMLGFEKVLAAESLDEKLRAGRPVLTLTAITAVAGPGAGLAWLMCTMEEEIDAADALAKQA